MIFITQVIGLVATLLVALTYIRNTKNSMLFLQLAASILFVIHYWLLGAYTGALLSGLIATRCLVYWKWEKNKLLVVVFMVAFVVAGVVTGQRIYDLLPALGSVLFSLAFWFQQPKQIRLLSIPPSLLWGAYGILTGSWCGLVTEVICLCSIAIGYLRYDFKKKESIGTVGT